MSMSDEITLGWMPHNTFDEKPMLVQIMACWCQAANHYLSQCWPRSMLPCGINSLTYSFGYFCRGVTCKQVKIVADSLLFVKLHLLARWKKMQLIIISLQNFIPIRKTPFLSLCHIKKSVLFVNIYVVKIYAVQPLKVSILQRNL